MSATQSMNNVGTVNQDNATSMTSLGIQFFDLKGSNIVLIFVFSGLIALMIFIGIQRIVARVNRSVRFLRKQIEPGAGAPKKLLADINSELDKVAQFMFEPKLLCADESLHAHEEQKVDSDFYRKKTVDEFTELDTAFSELNIELKRPMGKDVHLHLLDVKSHSSGCLKSIRTSHLHSVSEIYVHARYEAEPFGINDYKKFKELSSEIVSVLRRRTQKISKTAIKPSTTGEIKKQTNKKEHNERQQVSATNLVSDIEPLVQKQSSVTSPLLSTNQDST